MANGTEEAFPWTIKAVPVHLREKAVRYAKMEGLTVAEWLGRAVETEANRQDGNAVIPPRGKPLATWSDGPSLGESAEALQAIAAAATAGLPGGKAAARETMALIRSQVRTARGLPPLKPRQTIGQTSRRIGQTISQDIEAREPEPTDA